MFLITRLNFCFLVPANQGGMKETHRSRHITTSKVTEYDKVEAKKSLETEV